MQEKMSLLHVPDLKILLQIIMVEHASKDKAFTFHTVPTQIHVIYLFLVSSPLLPAHWLRNFQIPSE